MKQKLGLKLFLIILLTAVLSGCGRVASESNFTLSEGDSVQGGLFILSQNATIEEGSTVDGSVVMICCNLDVYGEVNGDVFLLTGNLWVHSNAQVAGDVGTASGNVMNE